VGSVHRNEPALQTHLSEPACRHWCVGSPFEPELSRVVSRTGPQGAWLSEMLEVSKIAKGR
jgi:hypothetical protein